MSLRKEIGKIQHIRFGHGGYQDAEIGVSVILTGPGWGVSDFKGYWAGKRGERAEWSEEDRIHALGTIVIWVDSLLTAAKKNDLFDLQSVPVEVTFDGTKLYSWRILTEVL